MHREIANAMAALRREGVTVLKRMVREVVTEVILSQILEGEGITMCMCERRAFHTEVLR